MPEVTITLDGHAEELAVFGSRDQHLRQIRDALGIKAIARHGEVRLEGESDRVERARQVFEGLRNLHKGRRPIHTSDVADLIDKATRGEEGPEASLEIREGNRIVRPRSDGQSRYLRALQDYPLVLCAGPAGTGKTYLAVAMAVTALRKGRIKKIVLVRPAVEAGEHLGFLPGDLEAKINPYLRPLLDALHDLMDYDQIRRYMSNDLIEIAPLAYMRGRTLNDAMIILDEGQNATIPQMKMFLTRMGTNARIVVTGDPTQVDLPAATKSGLADALDRLGRVDGVATVYLDRADIVRHPLVQAIVNAYEDEELGRDAEGPTAAPTVPAVERPGIAASG
ncbi:PhoH-like protein [Aquisphaera giovannonii]|uniref:PhoH-like protein n=1 Tax=Aquisphaera giovannonii TaxID=406548 RepID=A0A5B9W0M4_9BACT|nr:PhoH family protein [Aquisphaera giovannonii]QEH33460.1 PhoH-like protein [Aquisphaera giovannonii]